MFFSISLYVALAIFGLGLIYKVSTWFRYKISIESKKISTSTRISSAIKGIVLTLFSAKLFTLVKVFVLDVILQRKIFRESFQRWLMHMCIFMGFMLLILMHALDQFITSSLFADYYPTINPFMFLRDLFGAVVILGIIIAICRRFISKEPRIKTNSMDVYAIVILAVIMLSGIFLEGAKIVSYTEFQDMVEDYGDPDDKAAVNALEAYWVQNFSVVSPNVKAPVNAALLKMGREVHEMNCAGCHSRPQGAFLGFSCAQIMKPFALQLDRTNIPTALWYIHFLACWIGLAYLPVSKMFHVFVSPLSLLTNAVMLKGKSDSANIATRQIMELDACTHCCTCTVNCSAWAFYEHFSNMDILPSEKIISIKALVSGSDLSELELKHLQEGIYLCTNCKRCTVVCPVGINLQDLWFNVRETVLSRGYPEVLALSPLSFYRGLMNEGEDSAGYKAPLVRAREAVAASSGSMIKSDDILSMIHADKDFKRELGLSDQVNTFMACFGCETCTSVCPVVANFDNPIEALGLLPHQIMHSCGLGMKGLALGSNMLWDCLTCYQCQEQCPQGVCITDILYELKNEAVRTIKKQ